MSTRTPSLKTLVLSSDRSSWILPIFAYLADNFFTSYLPITVLTETIPPKNLPENYKVELLGEWPRDGWVKKFLQYINSIQNDHLLILLDDYFFVRDVDTLCIDDLVFYMDDHPNVLRIDLTNDRYFSKDVQRENYDVWRHYDLVDSSTDYSMSLQAGLWNRKNLISVLTGKEQWSPWLFETGGSHYLNTNFPDLVVLGTRQCPMRYINAYRGDKHPKKLNVNEIPEEYRTMIEQLTPQHIEIVDYTWWQELPDDSSQ